MQTSNQLKKYVLLACLFISPLLQLIGDSLWLTRDYSYSWNIWREASYIFFIPVGFLLAKCLENKNTGWAIVACGLFIMGCAGAIAMMPLFRLGGFYLIEGHNEFPAVVQSVLNEKLFAITLFPPGLCFPVSLVVFGFGFLRYKTFSKILSWAFVANGIMFWLGNAGEIDPVLIIGDAFLLLTLCYTGYTIYNKKKEINYSIACFFHGSINFFFNF